MICSMLRVLPLYTWKVLHNIHVYIRLYDVSSGPVQLKDYVSVYSYFVTNNL